VYAAVALITAGDISADIANGWTFNAGRVVDANITSEANNGGLLRIVTSAAHGLTTNDLVMVTNANNAGHNGPTKVTRIDATTFDCQNINYVAGAGASAALVVNPTYLQAGALAAGIYVASMNVSWSAGNTKNIKFELKKELTDFDQSSAELTTTGTGRNNLASRANISIAVGDRLWLQCQNKTDATEVTITDFNVSLNKI